MAVMAGMLASHAGLFAVLHAFAIEKTAGPEAPEIGAILERGRGTPSFMLRSHATRWDEFADFLFARGFALTD